jgi:hypothetical protein
VKTISLKKVAVIAVASLGFGLLSVVPASAALATTVAVVTNASGTVYGTVGTAANATINLATTTNETGGTAGDSFTLVPTIASQPVGGGLTVGAPASGTVGLTTPIVTGAFAATATADKWTNTVSAGVQTLAYASGTIPAQSATAVSTLALTATVAGTYTVTVTPTGTLAGANTKTPVTVTFNIAGLAYSLGDGAAVTPATTGNGIAGPANTVTVNATTNASNTRALVTVSGAGATINSNAGTALVAGATSTIVAAGTNAAIIINTPTAGTVTVSQFYESGNGTGIYASTASKTATITVGAAALNGTISVANSTSIRDTTIASDNAAHGATSDESNALVATASTTLEAAVIKVVLKDTLTNVMPDATSISATITGPGLLAIGTTQQTAAVGRAVSSSTLASGTGTAFISVYPDGTSGVATITISSGTTVVAAETITFYGAATKYTATVNIVAAANATTSTDVVNVCATDSAGIAVPGETIYGFSGDTTVATIETSVATVSTAVTASGTSMANNVSAKAIGCEAFNITALSQTTKSSVALTFGNASTIAASTVTTTATVLVGSVAATTITVGADKASYTPGQAVVLTLSFKDSVGRPVAYGPGTATLAAALTSSSALGTSALFGTDNISKLGTTTQTVYAPLSAGLVTVAGTTGAGGSTYVATAGGALAITTSFTVVDANQASILTQIDALNAKIVALNALIAKIMKKLGVK